MNQSTTAVSKLSRLQARALAAGALGALLLVAGLLLDPQQFYRSYLLAYLFWLALSLGCMGLAMLHHLVGGGWGFVIRRQLEAGAALLPWMAVLFIPILVGMEQIFPWAHTEEVSENAILQLKQPYLNPGFFTARAVFYFAVWAGIAFLLNRWSLQQDRTADADLTVKLKFLSGPGLVVYGLTATFASVDWLMSLEPEWYSTIYGLWFLVGHALSAIALVILVTRMLAQDKPLSDVISAKYFHDLGNLMLAFVLLWAYLSFSQFLIIWSGNLPEEIPWYLHRMGAGWQIVALILVLFHFAVPFLVLLSRRAKRFPEHLSKVAVWMLVMRFVDLFWQVQPSFGGSGFTIHWLDLAAPLAVGGVWLSLFARRLKKEALMPLHDPRLEEAFGEHGVLNHG